MLVNVQILPEKDRIAREKNFAKLRVLWVSTRRPPPVCVHRLRKMYKRCSEIERGSWNPNPTQTKTKLNIPAKGSSLYPV